MMGEAMVLAVERVEVSEYLSRPIPMVKVEGVSKEYANGTLALDDTTFDVMPGEFVSIVGASGCGKSTLLRIIAGLGEATEGSVTLDGQTPVQARKAGGQMTYVFQEPTLLPWRSVIDNVELPMELQGIGKSERREAAMDALALVGLGGSEQMYPRELSGGMKMRTSLARALALNPRLLLMDEPFGALDEITRQRLNEELLRIWQRDRRTVIFVTHSVFEATFLSTRVMVMRRRPGCVVEDMAIELESRDENTRMTVPFLEQAALVSQALRRAGE
jgi:NitT/TauT family transport system ATP-binding protein